MMIFQQIVAKHKGGYHFLPREGLEKNRNLPNPQTTSLKPQINFLYTDSVLYTDITTLTEFRSLAGGLPT